MALSLRQKLTVISLLLYWPGIFILAHIPIPQLVYKARVSDKALHFLVYFILVFLLWSAIRPDKKVNWRRATVWWVLFVVVWYGVFDEWLQTYTGRTCDAVDFLSDLAGALTVLILLSFFSFWPALLVTTGITIFLLTNLPRTELAVLMPVANAVFHLVAYALFTVRWIRYMYLFLSLKAPGRKWLLAALALPTGLLAVVKSFSVICGKQLEVRSLILSAAAIAVVVFTFYLTALYRQNSAHKQDS